MAFNLLCLLLLSVSDALASKDKCRSLLTGQDKIRLLGALPSRFVVITTNGNVFDLALSHWNSSINKLHLDAGATLKDKWPLLDRTLTGGNFRLVVALTDNQREYIVAIANDSMANSSMFDIENGTMTSFCVGQLLPSSVSVSSNDFGCMYGLSDGIAIGNQLTKYGLGESMLREKKNFGTSWFMFLCSLGNGEGQVLFSQDDCTKKLDWQVYAGFEQQGQLYLIEPNMVHVIDFSKFRDQSLLKQTAPVTNVPFDHFFECTKPMTVLPVSQSGQSTEALSSVTSASSIVWIIVTVVAVIIMILLALLLIVVYFCWPSESNNKARSVKNKQSRCSSKNSTSKVNQQAVAVTIKATSQPVGLRNATRSIAKANSKSYI